MSTLAESVTAVVAELKAALKAADIRAHDELSEMFSPPAAVIGPPTLTWDTPGSFPRMATFQVALVVRESDRAAEKLYEMVPAAVEAIETHTVDAVVTTAAPGLFQSGAVDLPSYSLTVEVGLS